MKDFEVPEMIESMGGNSGFEFSPVQYVSSIPQAIDGIVSSPILMAGSAAFWMDTPHQEHYHHPAQRNKPARV